MPHAERDGDQIVVRAEYREYELMQKIPGALWDEDRGAWATPLSWAAAVQLRGIFGSGLTVGPELAAWSVGEYDGRIVPCLELRTAEDCTDVLSFPNGLYPFQRAGAQFLAVAGRALIADEMGLGKSAQAIAAMELIGDDAYPALIVCPNSMKFSWEDEFKRWAPNRAVAVAYGDAGKKRKAIKAVAEGDADAVVINWESLRTFTRVGRYGSMTLTEADRKEKELNAIPWGTVVADEAHKAKDPHTKQARALWYVGDQARHRFALTGTPVANSPEDLWSIMRFVAVDEYPRKTAFVDRYGLLSWSPYATLQCIGLRAENRDEFFKILDPRMIRRTKAAVLPELPEKTYTTRYAEMGAKQKKAYDQIREHMLAELDGGTLLATSPLTRLTRLIQFASACGEIDEKDDLVLTPPSCKVDALEEIAAELGGQKCVVFTQSVQLADMCSTLLGEKGYNHAQISGKISTSERHESVRKFQDGPLQFLVVTLGAGGEGLTLTAASVAVFLQRSFSLVQNVQAEDRIHRIGQDAEKVEIVDVVTRGTIEAHVHDVMLRKQGMLEEVVRDADTLRTWLQKEKK